MSAEQVCTTCGERKSLDQFRRDQRCLSGYRLLCKSCHNRQEGEKRHLLPEEDRLRSRRYRAAHADPVSLAHRRQYNKTYYARHRERLNAQQKEYRKQHIRQIHDRHLQTTYGITLTEYGEKIRAQNGRCAICEQPDPALGVDHDHRTGVVRELLCGRCNSMLGFADDNVDLLSAAAAYVRQHQKN